MNHRGLIAKGRARAQTALNRAPAAAHGVADLPDPGQAAAGAPGLVAIRRMVPLVDELNGADQRQQIAAYTAAGLAAFFDNAHSLYLDAYRRAEGVDRDVDLSLRHVFLAVSPEHRGLAGFSFEWAVHVAVNRAGGAAPSRLREITAEALDHLGLPAGDVGSVLLGGSQRAALGYTERAAAALGEKAVLRYGGPGRPVNLARWLPLSADVARGRRSTGELPARIAGLPAADLLIGCRQVGTWVGATCKSNPRAIAFGPGVRLGYTPAVETDGIPRLSTAAAPVLGETAVWVQVPGDYSFLTPFRLSVQLLRVLLRDRELRSAPSGEQLAHHEQLRLARWLFAHQDRSLSWILGELENMAEHKLVVADSLTGLGLPVAPAGRALVVA